MLLAVALPALAACAVAAPQDGVAAQEPTVNRLANETSPYLRQHQHNPVDWYPWGPDALALARRTGKPIFLSIGYSACHWCHVMERESFEKADTAALMNAHYVCIKVDREERPDLDEIYMAAVQAMTGQGGWPMSVWLTPELQPFYGGTYFPPEDGFGRPGFPRVLTQLAKAWQERRQDCVTGAQQLTAHLQQVLQAGGEAVDLPSGIATTLREQSARRFDERHGGFAPAPGHAPKFPHAAELGVLLRLGALGDDAARQMALMTLEQMAAGGIHDQLAGGFHRYSTDREWLVPHFEKMLYDNAQLAVAYADAFVATGDAAHADTARRTLDWMLAEMQAPEGGFRSSQDADTEGVEGRYFVWPQAEFAAVLGADAAIAAEYFGVTAAGNWEHTNVLWRARPMAAIAAAHGRDQAVVAQRLQGARQALLAARSRRVRPATDDKVLAAWSGLAIEALARGQQVLGESRYLTAAQRAATFVTTAMQRDGRLFRSWHSGTARHRGYLEDHAFVADALLTLFETDADPRWLREACALLDAIELHYRDEVDGNLWFTADDHEQLLARSKSAAESSTPSGIAIAARAWLRLGLLLGDERRYGLGLGVLRANGALLRDTPVACPSLVQAWQFHAGDPREIVVVGPPGDPRAQALVQRAHVVFPLHRVVLWVHDGNRAVLEGLTPVVRGKVTVGGVPAAYVCRRGACEAPITDPARLLP